ncbi:DUF397 domain-containing protein [Micromonospora sp. CPCC 206061]|uniref:DUF397 domain-containing protein n=1 Tax=Micromonospora sp. CPCC 206061 TaxID=3122410 RepID=UPI002FF17A03
MAGAACRVWRKSKYCDSSACVEVARTQLLVAVRDGKDPAGPILIFRAEEWRSFVGALRRHQL